jgi:hypothetical protein
MLVVRRTRHPPMQAHVTCKVEQLPHALARQRALGDARLRSPSLISNHSSPRGAGEKTQSNDSVRENGRTDSSRAGGSAVSRMRGGAQCFLIIFGRVSIGEVGRSCTSLHGRDAMCAQEIDSVPVVRRTLLRVSLRCGCAAAPPESHHPGAR